MKTDAQIMISNNAICKNIDKFSWNDRWFLAQNILNELRTFVEAVAVKIAKQDEYLHEVYRDIARTYIAWKTKYKFLYRFHENLQVSKSHYSQDEQNSERLMLKYFEYLLKIKKLLREEYNLVVLENLNKFPLKIDPILIEYYEKIVEKIEDKEFKNINKNFNENFYIWKTKPFFVNDEIYHEITFSIATENTSKFDRIIAFTKLELLPNYSVKLKISNSEIEVFSKKMPILIVEDYEVSIRPCELVNFAKIFDEEIPSSRNNEYKGLMDFLTKHRFNLVEIIDFSDRKYELFKEIILKNAQAKNIACILDKSRDIIKNKRRWSNILRYLLHNLNNKVIKDQLGFNPNNSLSNLKLDNKCIPFDKMPLCSSLVEHNPRVYDLVECIDPNDREHEFLARHINNNAEKNGKLYTEMTEIENLFGNVENLINSFNAKLDPYGRQPGRKLEFYKNHIFRKSHEEDIVNIIQIIKELTTSWFDGYSGIVEKWIDKNPDKVDNLDKKGILKQMFEVSKVALIYGSAGTWKTKLTEHVSDLFENATKLFLANTNPAVDNLKNRVNSKNSEFYTITKFLNSRNANKYNVLIIDECSTVSNSDILRVLQKAEFDSLILVWDTYQIESINFGNWFSIIRSFIPKTSVFELETPYRTTEEELIQLWWKVRNIDTTKKTEDDLLERILPYSDVLNDSIFEHSNEDEIMLCLNYDWLYGINNINRFLQESNPNEPIQWGTHVYKAGDPVLFNESSRFSPLIYNNLKWRIINIEILDDKVYFSIEVDKVIEENDIFLLDLSLIEESKDWKSKIRFRVNKLESTDEDVNYSKNIVPFQVAYAVSIHKSQWLEYSSVKIIISDEIWEMLTHNIFYTAITRARKKLKIYWSPETSKKVLENMESRVNKKDACLLKSKYSF